MMSRLPLTFIGETISPLGWMVAGIGLLSWLAGVVLGWDELLVVAATSLILMLVASLFTVGRLDLTSEITLSPSRVVVGGRAAGELVLLNNRARSARGLRIELPVGDAVAMFPVSHLRGGEQTDELFVVPTNRRAVIPVGPVATVQGDPLGMMRRTRVWSEIDEIFVHPRTVPVGTMAAGLIRDMEGQATNQLSPSDVAFHTLRDYVPGDDLRHVHWKSSAKLGELQVRQYVDTRRSHVAVLLSLDTGEYADDDEFELSVSCAASIAVQALREDQTLSMFAGGQQVPATNSKTMLDHYSAFEARHGSGGIDECLQAMRRLASDASVVVVCVGASPSIPEIQRACARLSVGGATIVFRSVRDGAPALRRVGSDLFVDVPKLEALGPSMQAATI